jgi:hypothetical protein
MNETILAKVAKLRAGLPAPAGTQAQAAPEGQAGPAEARTERPAARAEKPSLARRRRVGGPAQLNLRMSEDLLRVLVRVAADESAREGRMVSAQEVAMGMIERGLAERGIALPGEARGDG